MTQTNFKVEKRVAEKPKHLRQKGIVPGNIFGGGESVAVQMGVKEITKLHEEAGETSLIYIQIDQEKKQRPVLIEEVQIHPVTAQLIHVAFKQVDLTDKITANIPVEIIGKFEVPEAVMMVVKDEIEVEALPTDLPDKFEIDVSLLKTIGQVVAYKDLQYDKTKVKLVLGEEGEDEPVVLVQEQREEEPEEVPVVAEPVEGETPEGEKPAGEADKKAEPGEKPAGGADKKPAPGDKPAAK